MLHPGGRYDSRMTTLVWFRRDLRLHDHTALATALVGEGAVQPLFIFDPEILARFGNKDDRRLSFIAAALADLHTTLKKRGGGLLVLYGKPREIMPKLVGALDARQIVSAEDFEPATIARDAAVKKALPPGVRFVQVLDHLLQHPKTMRKDDGAPYKVFTPYYKKWRASLHAYALGECAVNDEARYADIGDSRQAAQQAGLQVLDPHHGATALLAPVGYRYREDKSWGVTDAQDRLENFIKHHVRLYPTARDFIGKVGTSRLSPYLRHGLISIRECARAALEAGGGETWIKELGWREFYTSILYHFPQVLEHEFVETYRHGAIPWRHDRQLIEAFTSGRTGYPVVDAAIRELLTTGWMHNRARMIVASFATKHLLLDWRIGEEFFAQYLMDYELASNNGGWQWSASTGTDAQPYFRVFNPVLQSKKFDSKGAYIRQYLPELAGLDTKDIHAPWESLLKPQDYPAPIVDHAAARARAITVFKNVRG